MSLFRVLNCQKIEFNANVSEQRLSKAKLVFGEYILKRLLSLSLYVLGAKRTVIAELLSLPENTVRSTLKTIMRDGFDALKDRRKKNQQDKPQSDTIIEKEIKISISDNLWQLKVNGLDIFVPKNNPLQFKSILLCLSNNNLISKTKAAGFLNISSSHVAHLEKELLNNDLPALLDKRMGQQKDYKFTSDLKSEMIIQFSTNAALGKSVSSDSLSKDIEERTKQHVSPRSIRFHISKLGLKGKSQQLFNLIGFKKKA